ncbi:hypothetical protein TNCV_3418151 [Trichonephila clavipes]|nr:hypothetical protein TNCV_3418151 [Trichonephila clavipes]
MFGSGSSAQQLCYGMEPVMMKPHMSVKMSKNSTQKRDACVTWRQSKYPSSRKSSREARGRERGVGDPECSHSELECHLYGGESCGQSYIRNLVPILTMNFVAIDLIYLSNE